MDTYIGTPFDKVHDFTHNAFTTVAREHNMPNIAKCLNSFEITRLEKELGYRQLFFAPTMNGKMEGLFNLFDAKFSTPTNLYECIKAAQLDKENIKALFGRVQEQNTEVFWSHIDTWKDARLQINDLKDQNLFGAAGHVFGTTLVQATGGPIPAFNQNGGFLPYIIPDILPPIVIPEAGIVAADLAAGILYGITQREKLDQLGECFYGGDEFVYDLLKAYNMIASQTFAGIMNGAILLMSAVMYIPVDLANCIHAKDDIKAFEEWASIFIHPADLISTVEYNLKHHFAALSIEITKAKKDQASEHWASLGEDLGEMLAIVTTPIPTEIVPWFTFEIFEETDE